MKKRIIQIEIIHDISDIPNEELTSKDYAEYLVTQYLIDGYFLDKDDIVGYSVVVTDVEEGD